MEIDLFVIVVFEITEPKQAAIPLPGPEPKPVVGKNSLVMNTSAAFFVCLVFSIQRFLAKRKINKCL